MKGKKQTKGKKFQKAIKTSISGGSDKMLKNDMGNYTINMARSNMFYPALSLPKKVKRIVSTTIENNWYTITFDQLMDQTDFNIITAIISASKTKRVGYDGSMLFFFNLSDIQRHLNIKTTTKHKWLKDKLLELRKINVEIRPKYGRGYLITSIVRKIAYVDPQMLEDKSKDVREKYMIHTNKHNLIGKNMLFYVQFESEFVKMIHEDMNVYCNKLMPEILKIKSGPIQAMIKFLLTHKKIHINLDKLLYAIGIRTNQEENLIPGYAYISEQRYKQIKSEIRNAREMLKEKFGIIITDNDIVQYTQNSNVWYSKVKIPDEIIHPKNIDDQSIEIENKEQSHGTDNPDDHPLFAAKNVDISTTDE